jgi:hypothetical protein
MKNAIPGILSSVHALLQHVQSWYQEFFPMLSPLQNKRAPLLTVNSQTFRDTNKLICMSRCLRRCWGRERRVHYYGRNWSGRYKAFYNRWENDKHCTYCFGWTVWLFLNTSGIERSKVGLTNSKTNLWNLIHCCLEEGLYSTGAKQLSAPLMVNITYSVPAPYQPTYISV